MTLRRPLLPGLRPAEAAQQLRRSADDGALDTASVTAVLEAVGEPGISPALGRQAGLTRREVEVLRLLVQGLTNAEIAVRLHLAPKTVGNHVQNIYGRLGVRSRAAATIAALQAGLFSLHDETLDPLG
jgi:DNA-binding NarL/FixJ family response regulator